MAEAVLTDICKKIIEKLGSAAFKKIKSVKDLESNIEKLGEIKSIIAAELHKFDPFEVSAGLEGYKIKRLQRVYDDLDYFIEELGASAKQKELMSTAEKSRIFFSSSNQLLSSSMTAGKVIAIMKELKSIASDYAERSSIFSHSSSESQNSFTITAETSPFQLTDPFIGRDRDNDHIVNRICNSSNGDQVVAIVGVGGQGKTTLAQHVFQDGRVKGSFDQQLWVSLTPKSNINEILQKMIISASGKEPIYSGLQQLVQQVLAVIVGKKCLLVLDNVYYYENLKDESEELSAILEQGCFWRNGGKVLITSRSKKVAEYMRTFKPYELHELAEDDCWRLLQHYAFKNQEDKKECAVEEIGKEIVRMCPKVPLVLKIIGRYLADIDDISQWERFKHQLASNPTVYIEQHKKIQQILKLCYRQLEYNLKRCAAFCSLFPKGHEYDKNWMVHYWIALGYVESRDVGYAYVLELTQRAFFEEAHTFKFFKMHDVMHDLMQFIGKEEHQMIDSKTEDIVEGVRHVSLNMKHLKWDVLLSSTIDKQVLKSILLVLSRWGNRDRGERLGSRIEGLISACRNLKILEMYDQNIEKVPCCIGKLIHLRHLDLSRNSFCKLPKEITNLVNLSTLNLSDCDNLKQLPQKIGKLVNLLSLDLTGCWSLKELPRDTGKLVKLTHLSVRWSGLRCMPKGFGKLTKLEALDVFVVGENSRSSRGSPEAEVGAKLEELGHLINLKGGLRIKIGEESKNLVTEVGEANLEKLTKLSKLDIVFNTRAEEDQKFLEGIQLSGENWKKLGVYNYGWKRLPAWITDGQFHKRFPKLSTLVLNRYTVHPKFASTLEDKDKGKDKGESIRIRFGGDEDDLVELIPIYSRLKGQLKMGDIKLSFTTKRDGLRPTDLRDQTLHDVHIKVCGELASSSSCGRQHQPDVLFKSCFPNLTKLSLWFIPELEVLPEEFRDLSSLRELKIFCCKKLKALPDWIDSLSSLEYLRINKAPELKVLPDSIGSLTSLQRLELEECTGLELLPHHVSNLPMSTHLTISSCSKALFEKCTSSTGEYLPPLQRLSSVYISSSEEPRNSYIYIKDFGFRVGLIPDSSHNVATPLTLIEEPTHPSSMLLRSNLLFIIFVIGLVLVCLGLLYLYY